MATPRIYRKLSEKLWGKGVWLLSGMFLGGLIFWLATGVFQSAILLQFSIGIIALCFFLMVASVIFKSLNSDGVLAWVICLFMDFWMLTGILAVFGIY